MVSIATALCSRLILCNTFPVIEPGNIPVRLSDAVRTAILDAVTAASLATALPWTQIALFGSRTDLNARGGDIDLYIKVVPAPDLDVTNFKRTLTRKLADAIGEQKMDIIIDSGQSSLDGFRPIVLKQLIDLWVQK
jgi:hypothetical protein